MMRLVIENEAGRREVALSRQALGLLEGCIEVGFDGLDDEEDLDAVEQVGEVLAAVREARESI